MQIPAEPIFRVPFWQFHQELVHGCTTRLLGNLSFRSGIEADVRSRREHLATELDIPPGRLFAPKLTHSSNIAVLRDDSFLARLNGYRTLPREGTDIREGHPEVPQIVANDEFNAGIDGIVWDIPEVYALIITADCAPVSFYDPESGACGAAHIGLVGAINGLAKVMVRTMEEALTANLATLEAIIYPSVRSCHYDLTRSGLWQQIGADVLAHYQDDPAFDDLTHFDLPGLIARQLYESGVRSEHVYDVGVCTACRHDLFYSNVAATTPEAKRTEGRFGAVVGRRR